MGSSNWVRRFVQKIYHAACHRHIDGPSKCRYKGHQQRRTEMTKWLLICRQHYSENTSQYGYGDFPEHIEYLGAVVEADTLRKAQNAVKKVRPNTRFGGM